MDAEMSGCQRNPSDQQPCRYYKLCNGRVSVSQCMRMTWIQLQVIEIVVRRAKNDEKFVTLDGQERTMDDQVLMICDGEKAVGIAGIMGGENSMITDNVKTVLFRGSML